MKLKLLTGIFAIVGALSCLAYDLGNIPLVSLVYTKDEVDEEITEAKIDIIDTVQSEINLTEYIKKSDVTNVVNAIDESKMTTPNGVVEVLLDLKKQMRILIGDTSIYFTLVGVPATTEVTIQNLEVPEGENIKVDWGDGESSDMMRFAFARANSLSITHTYESSGDYTIKITGNITAAQEPISPTSIVEDYLSDITFDDTVDLTEFKLLDDVPEDGLKELKYIDMPLVSSVYESAFKKSANLEIVKMDACNWIGQYGFFRCTALTNVDMTAVSLIDGWGFAECTSISNLIFNNDIDIGPYAFKGCTGLTNIALNGKASLSRCAFANCTGLTEFDFSNVTNLSSEVFQGCTGLKSVNMDNDWGIGLSLSKLDFADCTGLETIVATNVTLAMGPVFSNCTSLVTVYLPSVNLTQDVNAPINMFYGCTKLESLTMDKLNVMNGGVVSNPFFYGIGENAPDKEDEDGNIYKCEVYCPGESVRWGPYFGQSSYFPNGAPTTTKFRGYDGYIVYKNGEWTTVVKE